MTNRAQFTMSEARSLAAQTDEQLVTCIRYDLADIGRLFHGSVATCRVYGVGERARDLAGDVWFACTFRSKGLRPEVMQALRAFARQVEQSEATAHVRRIGSRVAFVAGVLGKRWASDKPVVCSGVEIGIEVA